MPTAARAHVRNADIARAFDEIADLLELGDENPFRVRAYRNAARVIDELRLDIAGEIAAGRELPKIPGVGEDLAGKMREVVESGSCRQLSQLRRKFPGGITEMLTLPGLGPKRVRLLYKRRISSLARLRDAAAQGRLRKLEGFGEKTEQRLLEAVDARLTKTARFQIAVAAQYAEPYAKHVGAVIAGSYRRRKETVGDVDFLIASKMPQRAIERFVRYGEVKEVLAKGSTKASVVLACGLQVDLRVVAPDSLGAALHYFTGSKAHNIAVRRLGLARGLKINEYGVFRGSRRIAGETEESVYAAVGLPYIEPELREEQGEIEAARRGALPHLVELAHLQGDLHVCTSASGGRNTLREMALAAQARGWKYVAIADRAIDAARLQAQMREIDALNAALEGVTLLKAAEVAILDDGLLALPDELLAKLDLVIGALDPSPARANERILAALGHPRLSVLAAPAMRGDGAPSELDMSAIVRKARDCGVALELTAHPGRELLSAMQCRMAKDEGVRVSVASCALAAEDYEALRYAVGQARRGWLEKTDVLNARPLADLRRALRSG